MSDRGPTLAVVIPAYQADAFITDALDSVWGQTRRPDECVVVDDGSTDQTAARVEAWAEEHDLQLRLIRQSNVGAANSRSIGVRAASADWVALLDADDLLLPDGLATLEAGIREWPDLVACFGNAERRLGETVGSDYLAGATVWRLPHDERKATRADGVEVELRRITAGLFQSLLSGSYIANCAAIVRRDAAIDAGLWSDEFQTAEDRDFWLRLCRRGSFAYTPVAVARVRYHARSLTAVTDPAGLSADRLRVLQKTERESDRLRLDDEERAALKAARDHAVEHALYWTSHRGLRPYLRLHGSLRGESRVGAATHLRNLTRAAISPLIRAMSPRPRT